MARVRRMLVSRSQITYVQGTVPHLPLNLEEEFGKIVGIRLRNPSAISIRGSPKADAVAWRRAFGGIRVPRGIHRFRTHEEADEWLWQMISRPPQS